MRGATLEKTAICFLVINKMREMPEISINSALRTTDSDIYIGFLRREDLPQLPQSTRIKYVELKPLGFASDSKINYQTFADTSFYEIVQYKWSLLKEMLAKDYSAIIYSDTDVYWNKTPIAEIEETFNSQRHINVQIQSFSDSLNDPRLCMGFVAFRNTIETHNFIELCRDRHSSLSKLKDRVGDDDVVTELFKELGRPRWIVELPQTTFPVGRMLKLYASNSLYPGLGSPVPYIFHANYVIGLRNKILLLKLFVSQYGLNPAGVRLNLRLRLILVLKHLRFFAGRMKSRFN